MLAVFSPGSFYCFVISASNWVTFIFQKCNVGAVVHMLEGLTSEKLEDRFTSVTIILDILVLENNGKSIALKYTFYPFYVEKRNE